MIFLCVLLTNLAAGYMGYHLGRPRGYAAGVVAGVYHTALETSKMLATCSESTQAEFEQKVNEYVANRKKGAGS